MSRERVLLLLRVARHYYEFGWDQARIAEVEGVSRPTVSRLLAEARRRGIVRIEIGHPSERAIELEERLARRYALSGGARVAAVDPGAPLNSALGQVLGEILQECVADDSVIAASTGGTVSELIEELPSWHRPGVVVAQMIGLLDQANPIMDGSDIARRLARAFGGTHRVLPAPLIVSDARVAGGLRRESAVATALALGSRADVAVVGIGATGSGRTNIFDGLLAPAEEAEIAELGAVGHILGRHFDADGRFLDHPIHQRLMAVSAERLSEIPCVIAAAYGPQKVRAITAALSAGWVDWLITDADTASTLVDAEPPAPA